MAFVTAAAMVQQAKEHTAVGAFNVHNLEDIQAVVWAADKLGVPVILLASESGLRYTGISYMVSMALSAAKDVKIPVSLQLDHATTFALACECMEAGFSSVMIDGSALPLKENIALTKKVVAVASPLGVSVEGELGKVGGKEDDHLVSDQEATLTDPKQVQEFVEETGIDLFAPAIGTRHGFYAQGAQLDLPRLAQIREQTKVPLVLHGGSDLEDSVILETISLGIRKINVGTDLKYAVTKAFREYLAAHPREYEPRKVLSAVRDKAMELVLRKLRLFNDKDHPHRISHQDPPSLGS